MIKRVILETHKQIVGGSTLVIHYRDSKFDVGYLTLSVGDIRLNEDTYNNIKELFKLDDEGKQRDERSDHR